MRKQAWSRNAVEIARIKERKMLKRTGSFSMTSSQLPGIYVVVSFPLKGQVEARTFRATLVGLRRTFQLHPWNILGIPIARIAATLRWSLPRWRPPNTTKEREGKKVTPVPSRGGGLPSLAEEAKGKAGKVWREKKMLAEIERLKKM